MFHGGQIDTVVDAWIGESHLSEEDDDEEDDDESALPWTMGLTLATGLLSRRCARRSSVSEPRPIEVKKLMANRVLAGSSRGRKFSTVS